jgi:protein SCO1/2
MRPSFIFFLFLILSCERFTTWQTPKGGDFVLKTPTGVMNTADLRGKNVFIFFGFLNCPNVCPTTIREVNRMIKLLTPRDRKKFAAIFVTVDPERDTMEHLKERFAELDPLFIPATGTDEEVREALRLFGGDFKIVKGKSPDDIFVDHTSSVFVINRKGVWVNSLPYDTSAIDFRDAFHVASRLPPYWSDEARDARIETLGENEECDLTKEPCMYRTVKGNYEVELSPRPVRHLQKMRIIVRSKDQRLTPRLADFIGVELAMGLIRPRLVKTSDTEWVGSFTLPTCELKTMTWRLRLLLQDAKKINYEIRYRFSSAVE